MSQTKLVNTIQSTTQAVLWQVEQNEPNCEEIDSLETDSVKGKLQLQKIFNLLFSTIVWFIEQDPYTNIAMHIDVNY